MGIYLLLSSSLQTVILAVLSGHAFAKVEKRIMIDSKYIKCCTLGFLIM